MAKKPAGKTAPKKAPKRANLRRKRILLTNDDGINAPGMKVLQRIAKALSDDIWVVAPETEHIR